MTQAVLERPTKLRSRDKVSPDQMAFLKSRARYRAFVAGRGAGKSYAMVFAAREMAGTKSTGMIVAPTYQMLNDGVLKLWTPLCQPVIRKMYRSIPPHCDLINGSEVLFRSADDPDSLRGPNLSWFVIDEAALLKDDYAWKILIATLREKGCVGRGIIGTTPRGKANWVYQKFVVKNKDNPNYALFYGSTFNNPFTDDQFKQDLVDEYGVGHFKRQELLGEFCDPLGCVFQRHWFKIVDPDHLPSFVVIVRGWDLAISTKQAADFSVGVKLGLTSDGDVYVLNVIRQKAEWPDVRRTIIQTAMMDGPECQIKIEEVAFQLAALQELMREKVLLQYAVSGAKTEGRDKLSHALPIASRAQAGKVHLVRGAWNETYLDELCSFTGDGKTHDDQVDGTTIAARAFINTATPRITML